RRGGGGRANRGSWLPALHDGRLPARPGQGRPADRPASALDGSDPGLSWTDATPGGRRGCVRPGEQEEACAQDSGASRDPPGRPARRCFDGQSDWRRHPSRQQLPAGLRHARGSIRLRIAGWHRCGVPEKTEGQAKAEAGRDPAMTRQDGSAAGRRPAAPIPLNVLTGFLGAGKTTLLNRLLKDAALSDTAVVINEFGEVGIDHLLVEHADDGLVTLTTGCLCCTLRG